MNDYKLLLQKMLNDQKGNVKNFKRKIKDSCLYKKRYNNEPALIAEACGGFGDTEFEILDFKYIKGYPTFITNKYSEGLTGKTMTQKQVINIINNLKDEDTLCVLLGFDNRDEDDIEPIINFYSHCDYDLRSKETKKIYGKYTIRLSV